MRIQTLLEGLIKLPPDAVNRAMTMVCSDFLSRIFHYLNESDDEFAFESMSVYKRITKRMQSRYGDFDIIKDFGVDRFMTHRIQVPMSSLPRGYIRNKRNATKSYVIKLRTAYDSNEAHSSPSAEYYKKGAGRSAVIVAKIPRHAIEEAALKPEWFNSMIEGFEGSIEHELTHAVQDMAMNAIPDELDYYNADGKIDSDKYHSHPVEFDPLIKSETKDFLSIVNKFRSSGFTPSSVQIKGMAANYVGIPTEVEEGYNAGVSDFFVRLKSTDVAKWKKAVKYFYGLIQSSLKL